MQFGSFFESGTEGGSYLAVAAMYEEDAAFCEWVEHYVLEGADTIYVGTVGQLSEVATDNIRRYKSRVVHVVVSEDRGSDVANTEAFLAEVKVMATQAGVEWLLVTEVDEYVTTRKYNDDRLIDTLPIYDQKGVVVVYFPWLVFGSGGHDDNPTSVVSSLTHRMNMSSHLPRPCTSCLCLAGDPRPRRHAFGDGYIARPGYVAPLEARVAVPLPRYLAVSSRWDPLETDFEPGPHGTEALPGYRGWVSYPMDHTVVAHKYFYQSREHWLKVKCRAAASWGPAGRERAVASFEAGDRVSNSNLDTSLKRKRDERMKKLAPSGARLLMDRGRRCLSWQSLPTGG